MNKLFKKDKFAVQTYKRQEDEEVMSQDSL